ncbi:MAG: hexitol phosphatase HxpB [bacterium]|nr:hexitol phosphatase HxpB [bacterium]
MTQYERALVFDMDGVLIDSEPLWRRAEIQIFATVGLELSEADCFETQGLRMDEAALYWFARAPWKGPSPHEIAEAVVERMIGLIQSEGVPMIGLRESLASAQAAGWRLALASSSSMRLIETVLERFDLSKTFEVIRSAEHESHGKPHPDVYLSTLADLGLEGVDSVAIEDSANGVASALAAGMRCVAVPAPEIRTNPRFEVADWRLDSLVELSRTLSRIETERNDR